MLSDIAQMVSEGIWGLPLRDMGFLQWFCTFTPVMVIMLWITSDSKEK